MKKVLIVMDSMRIGGIQQSLINLLNSIDYKKCKVDLFLFNNNLNYEINDNVKVINSNWLLNTVSTSSVDAKKNGLFKYLIRTIFSVLTKICGSSIIFNFIFLFEKKLNGYDVAISFTNNVNDKSVYFGCNKFVLDKVSAKKKISWLHTDYNVIKSKYNSKEYKRFDKIVAVSKFGANTLVKNVPELEDKVTVIKNVINGDEICNKATLFNAEIDKNMFNIVCVGRLDSNKNQIEQIKILKKLSQQGLNNIKLYLIGDGPERKKIEKYIQDQDISNVIITGYVSNPLPYLIRADLCISTSLVESYSMALLESLILNVPTIVLRNDACTEIISNEFMIADTVDELYVKIKNVVEDKKLYEKLKKMSVFNNENEKNLKLFYKLIK